MVTMGGNPWTGVELYRGRTVEGILMIDPLRGRVRRLNVESLSTS